MVSYHTPPSPTRKKILIPAELDSLSKKRKWEESLAAADHLHKILEKQPRANDMKSLLGTDLHLETPLPPEWQRCLDIKSGQIYFYNTRTQKRASRDPRLSPEPPAPAHMSLDLELNLPCGSSTGKNQVADNFTDHNSGNTYSDHTNSGSRRANGGLARSPSWLTVEGDQQEMITAVCKKCHMLVMMSKSTPSCPNCKFMHPPDQNPPNLFNRRFSLLC